jgi:hypothetical protein
MLLNKTNFKFSHDSQSQLEPRLKSKSDFESDFKAGGEVQAQVEPDSEPDFEPESNDSGSDSGSGSGSGFNLRSETKTKRSIPRISSGSVMEPPEPIWYSIASTNKWWCQLNHQRSIYWITMTSNLGSI